MTQFTNSFSEEVWKSTHKYYKDSSIDDSLRRVAKAIASVEATEELRQEWEEKFDDLLSDFKATEGGRISSNAGTEFDNVTLANCFVGPNPTEKNDSLDGILKRLTWQSKTLASEGGWGENFSYIRPRGTFIKGIGVATPGAVKFMELFDKSSEIVTAGSGKATNNPKEKKKIRKGAMMSCLDCWHPDIVEFVTAKQQHGRLTKFNISVNFTDEFMGRVNRINQLETQRSTLKLSESGTEHIDAEHTALGMQIDELDLWPLIFPDTNHPRYDTEWDGDIKSWKSKGYPVIIHDWISVKMLWNLVTESTYNRAEPGVLFLDRANYFNPANYKETIKATNPLTY